MDSRKWAVDNVELVAHWDRVIYGVLLAIVRNVYARAVNVRLAVSAQDKKKDVPRHAICIPFGLASHIGNHDAHFCLIPHIFGLDFVCFGSGGYFRNGIRRLDAMFHHEEHQRIPTRSFADRHDYIFSSRDYFHGQYISVDTKSPRLVSFGYSAPPVGFSGEGTGHKTLCLKAAEGWEGVAGSWRKGWQRKVKLAQDAFPHHWLVCQFVE